MGLFGGGRDDSDDGGLRRRVDELERRVAALEWAVRAAGHASPEAPVVSTDKARPDDRVRQLVAQGKKIQAIKLLREQTGLGLKEAKDIVDQM